MMTEARLRELYGEASPRAAAKAIDRFDRHCREFIAASPFLVIATTDGETLDVSPKGDPAGFVEVEDDRHLLIPDRPGNNRLDGMLNLLRNPEVAVIFLIPGVDETLRVNGRASIEEGSELCARFAIKGRAPRTVLRVAAREIFLHCGKAPLRGGLWTPETWAPTRPVDTLSEIVRDHAEVEVEDTSQAGVDALYRRSLY
ncbi:pyridoxamine 5'-phosphate oxidase family protein [Roseovarius sp. SCSIO 43702]|uniref:pyridoxamine 5'-phosphate oxidase family protein n=1 Tax=Roseovarius sp. SCSIO 43702 TaxID=2823043 RepID=UPI001C73A55D|nr:pyridoxamine 5'-phosphate oxidase family protein [Roseovarius sp. SCSIO 43702]QYX56248.1 pyridoxamine 5'-phosphate oxidase family protein [Roseovarius sp. SCSIO 43702]